MKALLSLSLVLLLTAGFFIGNYVSAHNWSNKMENAIVAQYDQNKNVASNTTMRVMEMAQVNDMFRDDLLQVIEATFSGRYGENGSQAVFQFIQENNMSLDASLYRAIQSTIESGRLDFQANQTRLIDLRRSYETGMGYLVKGTFVRMAGFPKIDLTQYNIIIESGTTDRFNSGVDAPLRLR